MRQPVDVRAILRPADILLIVPPSAYLHQPLLGVHLLQALGRRAGVEVQVLYANLLFAARFGEGTHDTISEALVRALACERLFARSAFGGPALGRDGGAGLATELELLRDSYYSGTGKKMTASLAEFGKLEAQIPEWLASITIPAAARGYAAVGCSTCYEQNAVSIALLKQIKERCPKTITLLGGANCEGEMAEGLLSLTNDVDCIFSGDSEETFAKFAANLRGPLPSQRIIRGSPRADLDFMPVPDYSDYEIQLRTFLPGGLLRGKGWMHRPYETSRGCWWGEKSHCTFCGISDDAMISREKSAEKVLADLKTLFGVTPPLSNTDSLNHTNSLTNTKPNSANPDGPAPAHPAPHSPSKPFVYMVDKIIPVAYFKNLLPRIAEEIPGAAMFWAVKASLTLRQVRALRKAGVLECQPGIEALSTGLLRLMAKGTHVSHNIATMRYARAVGMPLTWSLLFAFPGDQIEFYQETLALLPLLRHLQPPWGVMPIRLHRFSPYVDHPERYGVRNLRPKGFYKEVLPATADIDKLAYYYEGDYQTALRDRPQLIEQIKEEIRGWQRRFAEGPAPELRIERLGSNRYQVLDTRGLPGHAESQLLDAQQAELILVARSTRVVARERIAFALASNLVVERDGRYVPLAVGDPDLLQEFEDGARSLADERGRLPVVA